MPAFPSVEWFEAVRATANQDAGYRSLGTCDSVVGIKVGPRAFLLTFEAFECSAVAEADEDGLHEADFVLEMAPAEWRELLENVQANGRADGAHTLNSLDLARPDGVVKSSDEYRRHTFFRVHLSLQAFFDASASVGTTFA